MKVTFLSPSALAFASSEASAEPSLSAASLSGAPGASVPPADASVGEVAGEEGALSALASAGPAADRAATRPAASAMRAARLFMDIGASGMGIPVRSVEVRSETGAGRPLTLLDLAALWGVLTWLWVARDV